jgi:4-diphosphocytidyl-2-C-methyl-D-erythritol kinase
MDWAQVTSRTDVIEAFAPAKINLFLHVGETRADGFHDLESLVAFADVGDTLALSLSSELTLALDGPFAQGLRNESDNLVLRAARTLAQHVGRTHIGAAIRLTKHLPIASGIGGGSADAAAVLRGLNRLWALDLSWAELRAVAEKIGSDVPVCVESKSSWMEGRGERVIPAAALPQMPMLLANPGRAVSTADVFRTLTLRTGLGAVDRGTPLSLPRDVIRFLKNTSNDLQVAALRIAPVIGVVLDELSRMPGVELWRMSGSGATCFALFDEQKSAELAQLALSHSHPDWWVRATRIGS